MTNKQCLCSEKNKLEKLVLDSEQRLKWAIIWK